MHLQARCQTSASPPDVEKLLRRVRDAGVNLQAVGGSDVEFGGEIALVPEHGQEDALMDALAPYKPRLLSTDDPDSGLTLCLADNQSGGLHACLEQTAADNLNRGRIIRDILIGVQSDDDRQNNRVPIQIYSVAIRTPGNL